MKTRSQVVEEAAAEAEAVKEGLGVDVDDDGQLRIVSLVCHAVDREVGSRSAAIVAIGDSYMASATVQLQLMMSRFPEHVRKMPMKKFLKQHCPNTTACTRSNGTLCFDLVQEPGYFQPPCLNWRETIPTPNCTSDTEKIYPAILPSQTDSTPVSGTKQKVKSTSRGLPN